MDVVRLPNLLYNLFDLEYIHKKIQWGLAGGQPHFNIQILFDVCMYSKSNKFYNKFESR